MDARITNAIDDDPEPADEDHQEHWELAVDDILRKAVAMCESDFAIVAIRVHQLE